jgi:hypothetical protein
VNGPTGGDVMPDLFQWASPLAAILVERTVSVQALATAPWLTL